MLKAWATGPDPWAQRPAAVVAVSSRRHPLLINSVATHLSQIGRLSLLPTVQVGGGDGRSNSAQRVRSLFGTITAPACDGPVLLVDDYTESGWTMALAARELIANGATMVLPFALASTS